jgi:hypothetical protein
MRFFFPFIYAATSKVKVDFHKHKLEINNVDMATHFVLNLLPCQFKQQ